MKLRSTFIAAIVTLVVLLLSVVVLVVIWPESASNDRWDLVSQQVTETRAQPLITAIEMYYAENEAYPDTLDRLIPAYLHALPEPLVGSKQWAYKATEHGGFSLYVPSTDTGSPSLLWSLFSGFSFDDPRFVYYPTMKKWGMAD